MRFISATLFHDLPMCLSKLRYVTSQDSNASPIVIFYLGFVLKGDQHPSSEGVKILYANDC